MVSRKQFLTTSGLVVLGYAGGGATLSSFSLKPDYKSRRPKPSERNFTSDAVEKTIDEVKRNIPDPELAWMFENCYPNTLDTTVDFTMKNGEPDTFVITGDIKAMWLRDSSAQVWPYLPLASRDKRLARLLAGVINRQTRCIHIDPYANAFNKKPTGSEWQDDLTDMKPMLHERKWEVDSLCYPVRLAHGYWRHTGRTDVFDDRWNKAMKLIIQTFREQQRKKGRGPYSFQRKTTVALDTVPLHGYGRPVRPVGLICSIFRPSDDATIYPFLVPSNMFAVRSLRQMAEMLRTIRGDQETAREAEALADEVETALKQYAVVEHPEFGRVYAYEVDGHGNRVCMDDPNIPSLLSFPYLGVVSTDNPIYQRTRRLVLSSLNPYYFKGRVADGIGSPHVAIDMIWPMSLIMQAMTSRRKREILHVLRLLKNTHAGTGFMHESFHKNDPTDFTRKWFAWSNTLFGELILKLHRQNPQLLKQV